MAGGNCLFTFYPFIPAVNFKASQWLDVSSIIMLLSLDDFLA